MRNILTFFIVMHCFFAVSQSKSADYYYKIKTFDRAIKGYLRELRKDPDNIKILENLTDSYLQSNADRSQALKYADLLLEKQPEFKTSVNYGKALFYANHFKKAIEVFESIQSSSKQGDDSYKEAEQYINWSLNAQAFVQSPLDVSFINVGSKVNTSKSELNPMIDGAEDMLAYSSNKRYMSDVGINYYNVCLTHRDKHKWLKGKTISSRINSPYDEILTGLTDDGKRIFVFNNRDWKEQVGFADYEGNYRFTYLDEFPGDFKSKKGLYGVYQSNGKDTLMFVAKNELGNTDIYYSIKLPNGEYGKARPIPGLVNTEWEENFPVLSKDNQRLYFCSDNKQSMGGYDLFYSDWNDDKKEWGQPVNLGFPINDIYDNYTISFPYSERYAYVSAIREDSYGERDIYKVVFNSRESGNMLIKGTLVLDTDSGMIAPSFNVRAELKVSISGEIKGIYVLSSNSGKFVMAIQPGEYKLTFYHDDNPIHHAEIEIPEMSFSNIPEKRVFVIKKETTEN